MEKQKRGKFMEASKMGTWFLCISVYSPINLFLLLFVGVWLVKMTGKSSNFSSWIHINYQVFVSKY